MKKVFIEISVILLFIFSAFIPIFLGQINFPVNVYKVSSLYSNLGGIKSHGYSISYQDILYNTYPWAKQDQKAIHSGNVPLWQFSNLAGYPLLANDQSQFFFPLFTPLLYITSFVRAINIEAFLKIILLAIGGYLFVSLYTKRSISRITGSLIIALNGFATMWLLWPVSSAFIFLPFILWVIEKSYREDFSYKYIVIFTAILVALEIFAGSMDVSIVFLFAVILFLIFIMIRERKIKKEVLSCILIGAFLGLLISMVQFYPFVIDILRSYYFKIRIMIFSSYVSSYATLLKFIYPGLFGVPWANSIQWVSQNFSETSFFIGMPAFYLGIMAFADKEKKKEKIFILLLFLLIVLIITGTIPFIYLTKIPIFENTLYYRMQGFLPLLYAILVALGIDGIYNALSNNNFDKIKKYTYIFLISIGLLSAIIIAKIFITLYSDSSSLYQSLSSVIFQDSLLLIFIILTFTIIKIKATREVVKKILPILILLFCITPLIIINYDYWQYDYSSKLTHPQNKYIKIFSSNKEYRVISTGLISPPEVNVLAGFNEFEGYDTIIPKEYEAYYKLSGRKNDLINFSYSTLYPNAVKYLRLSSVKYILLPFNQKPPKDVSLVNSKSLSIFTKETSNFLKKNNIYSSNNMDAMYYLSDEYHLYNKFNNKGNVIDKIKKLMNNKKELALSSFKTYDNFYLNLKGTYNSAVKTILKLKIPYFLMYKVDSPLKIVYEPKVVYKYSPKESSQIEKMKTIDRLDFSVIPNLDRKLYNSSNRVAISNYASGQNQIKFMVSDSTSKATFITINELYYPGWVAYDNNVRINLYRSNGIFDGIIINKKQNNIILKYEPKSFNKGIYLSLIGILILVVIVFI